MSQLFARSKTTLAVTTASGLPTQSALSPAAGCARNELEVQLFGLRRSGNHAVIAWIAQQYASPITFLNSVRPFCDPFTSYLMGRVPNSNPRRKLNPSETEDLRTTPKNLLLISYEDLVLRKLTKRALLPERQVWIGESRCIQRILVLRDFYNWIASRVRLFENKGYDEESALAQVGFQTRLWVMYAREFTGETNYLGPLKTVPLRFDRWAEDELYRVKTLDNLGIPVVNNSRSIVPGAGGGSSFDGTRLQGKAEDMDVGNRWSYLRAPQYGSLMKVLSASRPEVDEYNRRIFGREYPFAA